MTQYLRNWGLWARGIRWLWTRGHLKPGAENNPANYIRFKPGWNAWKFLPVYLSTYLIGTALGFGVVSISRVMAGNWLGRCIDWVFWKVLRQGPDHCANTGPWLWGSKSVWQ